MLEDSPTVPTLLTDYILTHICPSESYSSSNKNSSGDEQSTYLRSALRSLARGQHSLGSVSTQAVSQLRASFNSKLKSAARRSFSLTANNNGTSKCASVLGQNNNPDAVKSRKNSLAGTNFDTFNTIAA